MEESVELFKRQLRIDTLLLVLLTEQLQLQMHKALPIARYHRVSCGQAKLKVKVYKLRIVHLLQQASILLLLLTPFLNLDLPDDVNGLLHIRIVKPESAEVLTNFLSASTFL